MNIYRFVQVIPDDTFLQLKMLQFWSWFVVKLFRLGSPYWVSERSDCILNLINAFCLWSFIFLSSDVRYFPKITSSSSSISLVWGLFFKSARTDSFCHYSLYSRFFLSFDTFWGFDICSILFIVAFRHGIVFKLTIYILFK